MLSESFISKGPERNKYSRRGLCCMLMVKSLYFRPINPLFSLVRTVVYTDGK
ncbi:hypothetical protein HMPREF1870_01737 [Bacteroidales bacterium KA00344]|nr:hypothetical protein HMPREF1870_01737 [Bacteroidales bacterium KA00344]